MQISNAERPDGLGPEWTATVLCTGPVHSAARVSSKLSVEFRSHGDTIPVFTVIETKQFSNWLSGLKDRTTRARLQLRVRKASFGNLGDHKSLGESVWEMRETFGPGWRIYYFQQGTTILVMLGGGAKSSQVKDIERAKLLAKEFRNEHKQDSDAPI